LQPAWPTRRTASCQGRAPAEPIKGLAQEERRGGLGPLVRRRLPAGGGQPSATVAHPCDTFSLSGAVEPTTGERVCRALPWLHARALQRWVDHVADAFPPAFPVLGLDNSACHTAKTVRWPSPVAPVVLPPYSPELTPSARRWRDRKDQRAALVPKTSEEWSDAVCAISQNYSHATLHSLTGFAYFVQAVKTAQKALYG
jgi:hypothetical protein